MTQFSNATEWKCSPGPSNKNHHYQISVTNFRLNYRIKFPDITQ